MNFSNLDLIIFIAYCVVIIGIGLWISREKKGIKKDAKNYFLASKALPWWAVGASLISSNISAEQFIGMSGSGFKIGLAIASYEWMAALALIVIAVFFVPIYIKQGIFTMPQFLQQRFDNRVKVVMAIFWLAVFVFINLTSILYLGALAMQSMLGWNLLPSILLLAFVAAAYSIYGGLKAVAWTDVIQVVLLVIGGLLVTYTALNLLGHGSFFGGVNTLFTEAPEKLNMILDKSHNYYKDLPGWGVILGGMWVANLYYWGCNQYIIQRALGAKNVSEAQKGVLFAGFLKLLLPLIVVVPGIIAFLLYEKGMLSPGNMELLSSGSDKAYPILLTLLPQGIRGLAFAALVAAIVSSLASMMNSISTIFTMDIYKSYFNKNASETNLVLTGRITAFVAICIAVCVAPLLTNLDQAFQYIQEFTGFISPGALAIFLAGFFYKRATSNGALAAALSTFVFSLLFKLILPEIPFLDRMGYVFLICCFVIWFFALIENKKTDVKTLVFDKNMFKTSTGFKIGALIIVVITIILYTIFR
ncbi:MAG: sodium/sugar symporter [Bacteroidetes bacterium]|nr:sodium/sugar symporter [Bacteroidota bacterium]MCL2302061.1 sodium/sugar symporter [Lentimicrobiaceae bacterium]